MLKSTCSASDKVLLLYDVACILKQHLEVGNVTFRYHELAKECHSHCSGGTSKTCCSSLTLQCLFFMRTGIKWIVRLVITFVEIVVNLHCMDLIAL